MAKYEVIIRSNNPFELPLPRSGRMEIDAESEEQVKEFWEEAKVLPKFAGMRLSEINLLSA